MKNSSKILILAIFLVFICCVSAASAAENDNVTASGDELALEEVAADDVIDEETGRNILTRLFNNIDKIDIPELGDRNICVSVGGTFYPANTNDSFEALYERADNGLYESKKVDGNFATFHVKG